MTEFKRYVDSSQSYVASPHGLTILNAATHWNACGGPRRRQAATHDENWLAMSVRKLGDAFATQLHIRILKPQGFRKLGRRFSRDKPNYVELFEIQGDRWNSGVEPWLFNIRVRVRFHDVAPLQFGAGRIEYHADGGIERLVTSSPPSFELCTENVSEMCVLVGELVLRASNALPDIVEAARSRAKRGLFSPLPVPDTLQGESAS